MKKFKPLEWKKDGFGNKEHAEIELCYPIIYSRVCVGTDNSNKWYSQIFGSETLFNLNHRGLSTNEFAKELAENCYQEAMNKLYNDIEKMIDK